MKTERMFATLLFIVFLYGCATGSAIVTGEKRSAISPEDVRIYYDPPSQYETIGIVEASSDVEFSTQEAQNRTINELKAQAAKLGANGVILLNSGEKAGDTVGFYSNGVFFAGSSETKTARGKAIYVKDDVLRYVQNNTFHSTYKPKINIKIDDNYKYLGSDEHVWRLQGYKVKTNNYIFCITGDDKTVQKMAIIQFKKIYKTYFNKNYYGTSKVAIDQGNCEIFGKQYAYYTGKLSEKYVSKWKELLSKKGVKFSGSYLYKQFARRIPPKYDIGMEIIYYEEIDNKYSNDNWNNANSLSNEQTFIVSEFVKHFDENIKILNSKDIALTTNSAPDKIEKNNEILKSSALEKKFKALNNLRESGLITQEDYDKKKAELLERF